MFLRPLNRLTTDSIPSEMPAVDASLTNGNGGSALELCCFLLLADWRFLLSALASFCFRDFSLPFVGSFVLATDETLLLLLLPELAGADLAPRLLLVAVDFLFLVMFAKRHEKCLISRQVGANKSKDNCLSF